MFVELIAAHDFAIFPFDTCFMQPFKRDHWEIKKDSVLIILKCITFLIKLIGNRLLKGS